MSFTPSSLHLFPADDHQNYEDHLQQHLILNSSSSTNFPLLLSQPASSLSSSSSSCSVFLNPPVLVQDDRVKHDDYKGQLKQHQQLLKVNEYHISQHISKSFDFPSDPALPSILEIKHSAHEDDEFDDHELKPSFFYEGDGQNDSLKGIINERDGGLVLNDQMVPPKIRLSKKMNYMLSQVTPVPTRSRLDTQIRFQYHQQQQQPSSPSLMSHKNMSSSNSNTTNNYNPTTIRVCSDCNTTKTPLWRSGPRGPKSLCNACGIRQRKARRAMVAAAAATASTVDLNTSSSSSKTQLLKEKKLMNKSACYVAQYKKEGCKLSVTMAAGSSSRSKDPCHDNISTNLNKNSSDSHGVFPQDEKEAAILLMALSCG